MQRLAIVAVDDGDERIVGLVQKSLINADLRSIMRVSRKQSVLVDRPPILGAHRFVFPQQREAEIEPGKPRASDGDTVSVSLKNPVEGLKRQRFRGRERESDHLQLSAHCSFEEVSALENQPYF